MKSQKFNEVLAQGNELLKTGVTREQLETHFVSNGINITKFQLNDFFDRFLKSDIGFK